MQLFLKFQIWGSELNVLKYLLCGIASYSRGNFQFRNILISYFPRLKLEVFAVLGEREVYYEENDAKTNVSGVVPCVWQYSVCLWYVVNERLGGILPVFYLRDVNLIVTSWLWYKMIDFSVTD